MDAAHAAGTQITPATTTGTITNLSSNGDTVYNDIEFSSTLPATLIPEEGDYIDYFTSGGLTMCIGGGVDVVANDAARTVIGRLTRPGSIGTPARHRQSNTQPNSDPAKQVLNQGATSEFFNNYRLTFNGAAATAGLDNISFTVVSRNCGDQVLMSGTPYVTHEALRVNDVAATPAVSLDVNVPAIPLRTMRTACIYPNYGATLAIAADGTLAPPSGYAFNVEVPEGQPIPVGSRFTVTMAADGPVKLNPSVALQDSSMDQGEWLSFISRSQLNPNNVILHQQRTPSFKVISATENSFVVEVLDHDIEMGLYRLVLKKPALVLKDNYRDFINYDIQADGSQGSNKILTGIMEERSVTINGVTTACPQAEHTLRINGVFANANATNIPKGSVFASYVDEAGDPIGVVVDENGAADGQVTVADQQFQGTAYTAEQKTIEGYTFVRMGDNSPAATGRVLPDDQTVVFVYKKNVPATPVTPDPVDPTPVVTPTPSDPAPTPVKKVVKKTLAFTGSQAWTLMGAAAVLAGTGVGAVALRRRKA